MTRNLTRKAATLPIALALVGAALVLALPSGTANADKCSSGILSTNCGHQCSTTNGKETCETCSYHVHKSCVVDLNSPTRLAE